MLQSGDQWPFWNQEFEDDQADKDQTEKEREPTKNKDLTNKDRRTDSIKSSVRDSWKYASLGTELFASVLAGIFLGWLASWLVSLITGSRPVWTIAVGAIIGGLAGFLNMYRFIVEEDRKEEQKKRGPSR